MAEERGLEKGREDKRREETIRARERRAEMRMEEESRDGVGMEATRRKDREGEDRTETAQRG